MCNVTGRQIGIEDLPRIFGVDRLHDHQHEAIVAAVAGRDVILIVPTGSGKSLAFWGAGLIRGGLTLVVSPLRSLMADQCRRLEALDVEVRIWNSDISEDDKAETCDLLDAGWSGFLYSTPESLKNPRLSDRLTGHVGLATIDEAHACLTERGFRISYGYLGKMLDQIRPQVRIACTATLASADLGRLIRTLNLVDPKVITVPVARSNLEIRIVERGPLALANILNQHTGQAGIVFTATVAAARTLHETLLSQGRNVTLYHGRLTPTEKARAQADFMSGEKPVAVATDSFVLGIDHPHIRFIAHYDHPKSIGDWVQGFGRAGRDGLPAAVYGCFRGGTAAEGRSSRAFLIRSTFPPVCNLAAVWDYLCSAPFRDASQSDIGEYVLGKSGKYSGGAILTVLQRHGLAAADPHPEDGRRRLYRGTGDFDRIDWTNYELERARADQLFEDLGRVVKAPDSEIPALIDEYFATDDDARQVA
ncbi:MAG: ATP-dependent DNA helicase RecQ [Planctomycetes bacterium]|nr:ATP-dependent DNA helicase RecQ [Planctomycetota bacterium]